MSTKIKVLPNGWITTDLRTFHLLTEQEPPRQWSLLDQILQDIREPVIVWLWLRAFALNGIGTGLYLYALNGHYWLILIGVFLGYRAIKLFSTWFFLAHKTIQSIRIYKIANGVIDTLKPHRNFPIIFEVGEAIRPSGEKVDVSVEVLLAQEINEMGVPAEVLFIDEPKALYRTVFAARPVMSSNKR